MSTAPTDPVHEYRPPEPLSAAAVLRYSALVGLMLAVFAVLGSLKHTGFGPWQLLIAGAVDSVAAVAVYATFTRPTRVLAAVYATFTRPTRVLAADGASSELALSASMHHAQLDELAQAARGAGVAEVEVRDH